MNIRSGVDIISNKRIGKIIDSKRESFYKRVFTQEEQDYIKSKNNNVGTVAGIFAAKEAVSKLIGSGIGRLSWIDIIVKHDLEGRPYIELSSHGKSIIRERGIENIDISISNETLYSIAIAIGERGHKMPIPSNMPYRLKKRKQDTNKGDYGRLAVIGGSLGMLGAVRLTSYGALRSGAGLVYGVLEKDLARDFGLMANEVIVKRVDEICEYKSILKDMDSLVIGPGFSTGEWQEKVLIDCLLTFENPLVIDADGLNILSKNMDLLNKRNNKTILTPHPGEMARLLNTSVLEIQNKREFYAKELSNKYNLICVLKGHQTIVTDGVSLYVNTSGNPGMATGGSGDVLAGVIGSLINQVEDPYEACVLGVYLHGLAGDIAKDEKGEYGMLASDIVDAIPQAIKFIVEN